MMIAATTWPDVAEFAVFAALAVALAWIMNR
jgi:hypothetical protein